MLDLSPLRSVSYRHLVTAQWINDGGNWIGEVALALLVYDRTRSAIATAALFVALRFLPALIAPFLVARTEASPPRIVLPILFLVEGSVFAVIAVTSHSFSLPLTLALVAIDGVCAISTSALSRSAMATGLIQDGLLREGNSFMNLGQTITTAGAPIVGAALFAWRGPGTALVVDAATFVVAAFIVATARGVRIESNRDAGTAGRLKSGAAAIKTRPALRRLMIATVVTFSLGQLAIPIEVVFAKTTLHAGASGYGLLLTSWGVGMIVGAAIYAVAKSLQPMLVLGLGTTLIACGYGGLAVSPTIAVACLMSLMGGVGNGIAWVAAKTTLQEQIPLRNQSAVMSVLDGLNQVVPALAFIVGGVLATVSSPRTAYAVAAIGIALVVLTFLLRPINQVQLEPLADASGGDGVGGRQTPDLGGANVLRAVPQEISNSSRTPSTRSFLGIG